MQETTIFVNENDYLLNVKPKEIKRKIVETKEYRPKKKERTKLTKLTHVQWVKAEQMKQIEPKQAESTKSWITLIFIASY